MCIYIYIYGHCHNYCACKLQAYVLTVQLLDSVDHVTVYSYFCVWKHVCSRLQTGGRIPKVAKGCWFGIEIKAKDS